MREVGWQAALPPLLGCLSWLGEFVGEVVLGLGGLALLAGLAAAYAAAPKVTVGSVAVAVAVAVATASVGLALWHRSWAWPLRLVAVVVGVGVAAMLSAVIEGGFEIF